MKAASPHIVVLGSINMDLVIQCDQLPLPGETVIAHSSAEVPGGKGANQAVAASRAGGEVKLIGRVGDDGFAARLIDSLVHEGVNTLAVETSKESPSGVAIVAVQRNGENAIMVVQGANADVSELDVQSHAALIQEADVLLMQLEIPIATVLAALQVAKRSKTLVILDPAPMPLRWDDALYTADIICPNQHEAASLVGFAIDDVEAATRAAIELQSRGAAIVIIKMGELGAVVCNDSTTTWIEPVTITAVDTTAAGDAFAGSLGVRLAAGDSLIDAVQFASVAGAICATRRGAQTGMPTGDEITQLLRKSLK